MQTSEVGATLSLLNACTYISESLRANTSVKTAILVEWIVIYGDNILGCGVDVQNFVGRKTANMTTTFI